MIKPLDKKDYRAIFSMSKRLEPYPEYSYYDHFCSLLDSRRGFTFWNKGDELVAFLSYSDFIPGTQVTIHFMNESGGLNREVVKKAFGFPFNDLHVPILVSYSVTGRTDNAEKFLQRLGFTLEGVRREAARLPDGPRDIKLYGMLRRECRWLNG